MLNMAKAHMLRFLFFFYCMLPCQVVSQLLHLTGFGSFKVNLLRIPFKLHLLQDYDTLNTLQMEPSNEQLPNF